MASKNLRQWICYLNAKAQPNFTEVLVDSTTTATSSKITLNASPILSEGSTITNTTAAIVITGEDYYGVSYLVNGTTSAAGTVVITPYIDGVADENYAFSSVVPAAATAGEVVSTSGSFIVQAPATIEFYNTGIELSSLSGVITVEKI